MICMWIVLFLSCTGLQGVFSLTCYKCLSLDRLDMDCVELKGRGTANKNQYFRNCSRKQNACSIYQGHFKVGHGKPRIVVWRKCDYMQDEEVECKIDEGPIAAGENVGTTCKCKKDFCNWRFGVDHDIKKPHRGIRLSNSQCFLRASYNLLGISFFIILLS